ncbi:MAG: 2-dehydropantoate 2-reductase N-terminal domain-containing protein, partial [Acidimicrobiales bacterium]
MAPRVAVVGAGSWGTTVAAMMAGRSSTVLWARRPALARAINATGRNPDYLGGPPLPAALVATASMDEALAGAEVVLMAVPSHGFRAVLGLARPHLAPGVPVISLAKGVEEGSLQRMTEIIEEVAPGRPVGVLTGPNLAGEIAAGQPAASVIAVSDEGVA